MVSWADPRFLRGIARHAREADWHLNIDYVYSHEIPAGWRGDGCIASPDDKDVARFTAALKVPVIDVVAPSQRRGFPSVSTDDEAIGRAAAEYFLAREFKNLACYRTDRKPISENRFTSFHHRLQQAGLAARDLYWRSDRNVRSTRWLERKNRLIRELQRLPKPVAVFCIDDRMALNVIEACQDGGLDVPHDVAVLGVGNLELAGECSFVPLTSVVDDSETAGHRAAAMLERLMAGKALSEDTVLVPPAGIVERRSTDTLAVSDPRGRQAVRYLLEHFAEPIDRRAIAAAADLGLRQLTVIFRRELGVSPGTLLESIRLRRALELLLATDSKVDWIAAEVGLTNRVRLQRIFQRRFRTTPAAWRRAQRRQPAAAAAAAIPFLPRK